MADKNATILAMSFFKLNLLNVVITLSIIVAGIFIYKYLNPPTPDWTTTTVDEGNVSEIISVSGTIDATKTADLAFPISGIVQTIEVKEGQAVEKGDKLITLRHDDILAEFRSAESALMIAKANQSETLTGIRNEERTVANTKVEIAEAELARIMKEEDVKVISAYRTLLSDDLAAITLRPDDNNTPPEITGTYTCKEGVYTIDVFRSNTQSNYSYRLSGIENGTFTVYTDGPAPLGQCGLFIKFTTGEKYDDTKWEIRIPNNRSTSYVTNLNAYNLAITNRDNAINAAKQDLQLARENQALTTAKPRTESITKDEARIIQSEAEIARISSMIRDHILTAPFSGIISDIKPTLGETVGLDPVITMISKDYFEITALIPEIDVTKISIGQKAELVFDARPEEVLTASITFISPLAETIAGVSYFRTTMTLDNSTDWLRGGLNADINIIVEEKNSLRIPKRFLIETDGNYSVLVPDGSNTKAIPVTVEFIGNNGYVAVQGLNQGDIVIAP